MSDLLPLPPELQHLVEKRQQPDRRKKERRTRTDRRTVDVGPLGALKPGTPLEALPLEERRRAERRKRGDRRKRKRRRTD